MSHEDEECIKFNQCYTAGELTECGREQGHKQCGYHKYCDQYKDCPFCGVALS